MISAPSIMVDLETELGNISCWCETGEKLKIYDSVITEGHKISVEAIDYSEDWFSGVYTFTRGRVYRYFIEKIIDEKVDLFLYCKLLNPKSGTSFGGDSGQYLDALKIEGKETHLHIGTQDSEEMYFRLQKGDWVPKRLLPVLEESYSFSEQIDFGLMITVPELFKGERIYFHFAVVEDNTRPHKSLPEEEDISTWNLVNMPKEFFDKISSLSRQLTEASQNGS
jgi:hypothetical protein